MSKITIKDIARAAGVSRGTVDRVINDRGNVRSDKRDRILQIAQQIGYEKNVIASTLATNKTHQIAIVFPKGNDPYWKQVRFGIQAALKITGQYGVQLTFFDFDLDDATSFEGQLMEALNLAPSAILTAPFYKMETTRFARIAYHNSIPLFTINTEQNLEGIVSYVGQNSFDAGLLAGRILSLQNKMMKEVLVVTIGSDSTKAQHILDKVNGLQNYFAQNDMKCDIIEVHLEDQSLWQEKIDQLMSNYPHIKAVWFTNSQAYSFFKHQKRKFAPDSTVIGFDLIPENITLLQDGYLAALFNQNPAEQSFRSMMQIYDLLIRQISPPKKLYLPIDIVVKENLSGYINRDLLLYDIGS